MTEGEDSSRWENSYARGSDRFNSTDG
ncbi:MAG: hypothetical protein RLZZ157_1482, partial [Pseudomonadota bacterium]